MEAVNNAANAAARAVWGDSAHGEEPISDAQGNVPRGEPYDVGNLSTAAQQERLDGTAENTPSTPPTSTEYARPDDDFSSPNYSHVSGTMTSSDEKLNQHDKTWQKIDPDSMREQDRDVGSSEQTSNVAKNESLSANVKRHDPLHPSDHISDNERSVSSPGAAAAASASSDNIVHDPEQSTSSKDNDTAAPDQLPSNAEKETAVGHGDGPADAPSSDKPSDHAAKEASRKESTAAETAEEDPETSVMGDGPKSLAEVAKENGGDAGNSGDVSKRNAEDSTAECTGHEGEEASQESKGTGEQYVKTTGFAADGGDFDATKPGAGREADRLMEEKGMSRDGGGISGGGDGDKPSLGERIKSKLHKH